MSIENICKKNVKLNIRILWLYDFILDLFEILSNKLLVYTITYTHTTLVLFNKYTFFLYKILKKKRQPKKKLYKIS